MTPAARAAEAHRSEVRRRARVPHHYETASVLFASTQALIADASKRMKRPTRTKGIRRSVTNRRRWRSLVDSNFATDDMSSSGASVLPAPLSKDGWTKSMCLGSKVPPTGVIEKRPSHKSPHVSDVGNLGLFAAAAASTCIRLRETRCSCLGPPEP